MVTILFTFQAAIFNMISELTSDAVPMAMLDLFTHRVLLELCSSVTLTASRTAVQLIFGKANLVKTIHLSCT